VEIGKSIGILGAGAWGVAIALHWARLGYDVYLWCFEDEAYTDMLVNHKAGPFLPELTIPKNIHPTQNLQDVFDNTSLIFECVPILYLRHVISECHPFYVEGKHVVISTAKGVESESYLTATKVLQENLSPNHPEMFFCGINNAKDLAVKNFSAGVISGTDVPLCLKIRRLMDTDDFKVEFCPDIVGLQICSAFKHMLAIILGVFRGMNASGNTTVFFVTKCFKEISTVVETAGGNVETVFGLVGSLDLLLNSACIDNPKFQLGCFMGRGVSLEEINRNFCVIPEGINALISIVGLGQRLGLDLPICQATRDYLVSGYSIDLIARAKFLSSREYQEKAEIAT
jgi:glycerol-3-phosphate dehydrogenase (NAD(P)+)